jgi:hypothetical protein
MSSSDAKIVEEEVAHGLLQNPDPKEEPVLVPPLVPVSSSSILLRIKVPANAKPGVPFGIGLPGGSVVNIATPASAVPGNSLLLEVTTTTTVKIVKIDGKPTDVATATVVLIDGKPTDVATADQATTKATPEGLLALRERWRAHLAEMPSAVRWSFYGTVTGVFCTCLMLLALAVIYIFLNLFDKETPSWLSNSTAWTFVVVLMIAIWGSFVFLLLYVAHNFYRWLKGNPAVDFAQVKIPKFLLVPFYVVCISTFLALFTIFGTGGVYLSFAAMDKEPGEWFHSALKNTLLGTCLVALWGPFLLLTLLASHYIVTFMRGNGNKHVDAVGGGNDGEGSGSDDGNDGEGSGANDGAVSIAAVIVKMGQLPPSLRFVIYTTCLGIYFSVITLLTGCGLYASHKAFHDSDPAWVTSMIQRSFNGAILVAIWGAIVTFALWGAHSFDSFCTWQQHSDHSGDKLQHGRGDTRNLRWLILYLRLFSNTAVAIALIAAIATLGSGGTHATYALTSDAEAPKWLVTFLTKVYDPRHIPYQGIRSLIRNLLRYTILDTFLTEVYDSQQLSPVHLLTRRHASCVTSCGLDAILTAVISSSSSSSSSPPHPHPHPDHHYHSAGYNVVCIPACLRYRGASMLATHLQKTNAQLPRPPQ